jgi:hypothetical protein
VLNQRKQVLMDPELREVYNKFGPDGIKQNRRVDESHMLLEIAVFYATWGMLAFMLTLGKASTNARSWIYTGQIVMLIAEVSLMLQVRRGGRVRHLAMLDQPAPGLVCGSPQERGL